MATERRVPHSLQPAFRRIAEIAGLPPDWDSYGAAAPSAPAIGQACALVNVVAEAAPDARNGQRAPWTSAPIADGGLQVEWKGPDDRIDVQVAPDGSLGYLIQRGEGLSASYEEADEAPFDAILAAASGSHVPPPWVEQLVEGGRIVMPVGDPGWVQKLVKVTKGPAGNLITEDLGAVRFVPLIGEEGWSDG